jgi:hypothetical protein
MSDAPIRSRLMVRAAGLVVLLLALPDLTDGVLLMIWPDLNLFLNRLPVQLGDGKGGTIAFYWEVMNVRQLWAWVVQFGVSAAAVLVGALLLSRGSRKTEGMLARAIRSS